MARALQADLPHTLAALRRGDLSEWRATLLVRESICLSGPQRRAFDSELWQDPAELVANTWPAERFLAWVSEVDNQGWPPRPILVTGSSIPGTAMSAFQQTGAEEGAVDAQRKPPGARPVTAESNPVALGEALFLTATPACNACHSIAPGVNMAGPTMAGVGTRALNIIDSPEYQGDAQDAESYIRESIVSPSAYLVPGGMYSAGGQSFMPTTYGDTLTEEQIDHLVAYLASLR